MWLDVTVYTFTEILETGSQCCSSLCLYAYTPASLILLVIYQDEMNRSDNECEVRQISQMQSSGLLSWYIFTYEDVRWYEDHANSI